MATYYLKVSNEDSSEYESVTPPVPLASMKEGGYLLKYGSKRWTDLHVIILYTAVAVLSVTVGSLLLRGSTDRDIGNIFTPAKEVVEYYPRRFTWNFWEKGDYMGFPTDEIDQRWSDLYNFGTSGIPTHQAKSLSDETVIVPGDDSRSLVMLGVWHQLHCLNIVRKAVYRERYPAMWIRYENGSVNFETEEMYHIDHCIDHIRQALMCFADVSPTSFFFDPKRGNKPRTEGLHMCRNYEKIKDWAMERQVFYFSRDNETLGHVIGMTDEA